MINITICPSCGNNNIKKVQKKWMGKFEGEVYSVPSLEFYECPDCSEKVYDREAMRKIESVSPAFARKHKTKKKVAELAH